MVDCWEEPDAAEVVVVVVLVVVVVVVVVVVLVVVVAAVEPPVVTVEAVEPAKVVAVVLEPCWMLNCQNEEFVIGFVKGEQVPVPTATPLLFSELTVEYCYIRVLS